MIASMITSLTADMLARSRNQRIHGGGVELFVSCDQLLQPKNRLAVDSAIPSAIAGHSDIVLILNGVCVQAK